jgi:hypothetical protein
MSHGALSQGRKKQLDPLPQCLESGQHLRTDSDSPLRLVSPALEPAIAGGARRRRHSKNARDSVSALVKGDQGTFVASLPPGGTESKEVAQQRVSGRVSASGSTRSGRFRPSIPQLTPSVPVFWFSPAEAGSAPVNRQQIPPFDARFSPRTEAAEAGSARRRRHQVRLLRAVLVLAPYESSQLRHRMPAPF